MAPRIEAFRNGLRDLGYIDGHNITLELRFAKGLFERLPSLAAELVALDPDIILGASPPAAQAIGAATTTIPIIALMQLADPVDRMTFPGSNATGLRLLGDTALAETHFWLLSKVVPSVSRIGLLQNPLNPRFAGILQSALKAAELNGLAVVPVEARDRQEIETAFRTLVSERVQAVKVSASARFFLERTLIAAVALEHRLPTCFLYREHVEAGGLMSYGESLNDLYRRAATVADKLLKGAKPWDLPFDYPRRLHMTINRKTAVALGLTLPSEAYLLVDEMIE